MRRHGSSPARDGYLNAVQVYPYTEGALYQVYASPGEITDIALQPGEALAGSGPIAAGDTVRWIIGETESGAGATRRIHVLLKPTRADLSTNLVIDTDRRTYHLELRATPSTYMASVSWRYPEDELVAVKGANAAAQASAPVDQGLDLAELQFRYAITGDSPPWRPLRAFDDGRKVYIEMPAGVAQGELPPLFVVGPSGGTELVNYRVRQNYYVVDRLFAAAELRMGSETRSRRSYASLAPTVFPLGGPRDERGPGRFCSSSPAGGTTPASSRPRRSGCGRHRRGLCGSHPRCSSGSAPRPPPHCLVWCCSPLHMHGPHAPATNLVDAARPNPAEAVKNAASDYAAVHQSAAATGNGTPGAGKAATAVGGSPVGVPKLGPALPGDLGRPILNAQAQGAVPPTGSESITATSGGRADLRSIRCARRSPRSASPP